MPAISALQTLKNDLIRKTLNGSVFLAQSSAASVDETQLFDQTSGDLKTLPAGFTDLGYTTAAGASFGRQIRVDDVTSWQSLTPTRSDLTSDVTTLQVVCQETKLATISLYTGADPAALTPQANGVVRVNKSRPQTRNYRLLSIAVDETAQGEIAICRYLPYASPSSFNKQDFAPSAETQYDVTFTAHPDPVLGFSESYIFGGAGWLARLAAMGFSAVPVISSASPTALSTAGGQTVTINGSGFTSTVPTSGVKFAGTNATNWTVVNDSTITATSPAHAAGSGPIVVTNATGPSTTGPTVTYS